MRPPEHMRFKKGQSGNPAGRPRKSTEADPASAIGDMILAEARRLVTIVENGDERKITMQEAVVKANFKSAVRGNSYAQERTLARIEKAELEYAASIKTGNAAASDYDTTCRAAIEAALTDGLPEPEFCPHPDDIIVEAGRPWRIVGPATREDAEQFDRAIKIRDLFFLQSMLAAPPGERVISVEMLYAFRINNSLPPRMRHDDTGWHRLQWRNRRATKRELAKLVQLGWRDLGIETARGGVFPPLDRKEVVRRLDAALSGKA